MENKHLSHIHFALVGRQVWPIIEGVLMLKAKDKLPKSIVLLHTANEMNSAGPAARLKKLFLDLFGNEASCQTVLISSNDPAEITKTIAENSLAFPSETFFTVNATGGHKLMFTGLFPFFHQKCFDVFYLEISERQWFHLYADENNPTAIESSKIPRHTAPTRSIPILSLINTQATGDHIGTGLNWTADPLPEVSIDSLARIIDIGNRNQWVWTLFLKSITNPHSNIEMDGGKALEIILAAMIRHLLDNPRQGGMNLKLTDKNNSRTKEELDIAVNTGDQIVFFDTSIISKGSSPGKGAKVDQLAKVSSNVHLLGGLGAKGILFRPNWVKDSEFDKLAQVSKVEVWTQNEMTGLVDRLAKTLNCEIPESLKPLLILQKDNEGKSIQWFKTINNDDHPRNQPGIINQRIGLIGSTVEAEFNKTKGKSHRFLARSTNNGEIIICVPTQKIDAPIPEKKYRIRITGVTIPPFYNGEVV